MKTDTLLFTVAGVFVIIALIGAIMILKSPDATRGQKVLKKSGAMILLIILIDIHYSDMDRNYSLYKYQEIWDEYKLPQIDSMMHINNLDSDRIYFRSRSRDSIYHSSKKVVYELFDIYSIEDEIVNKQQDKVVKIEFVVPNIIRDSSRLITLRKRSDYMGKLPCDTLSIIQFDSLIADWGLDEIIYTKLMDYGD